MRTLPFLLERDADRAITGWWHLPEGKAHGTVLFLHGYKGYMDWGAWSMVGNRMAEAGWRFLRINFTHNGTSPEHPSAFVDLEAFAANTHRRELEEAVEVIRALGQGQGHGGEDFAEGPLAVIGHSRGGGIACLAAAEGSDARIADGGKGIDALITWAAVADFPSRFPTGPALEEWRASGRLEVINHRTRQRMHHDWNFHLDYMAHARRLDIESAVRRFSGRMLVAHGTDDQAVDIDHAHRLASWSASNTLFIMEGAGHTFGAAEPWTEPHMPGDLEALTQTTLHFLEEGRAVQRS